jgi:hypothetical protein
MSCLALALVVVSSVRGFQAQPASDGVHLLDDLTARWGQGQVSNALNAPTVRTVASGGVERRAGLLHPTARPARNQFTLRLPAVNPGDLLVLIAFGGVDDHARRDDPQNPHDGVRMRLLVEGSVVAEADCDSPGWRALSADLTPYAGKAVTVAFETDAKGNANYDWAYFAEAQVLRLRERFALKVARELPPEGVLEVRGKAGDSFTLRAPNHPPCERRDSPKRRAVAAVCLHGRAGRNAERPPPQLVGAGIPVSAAPALRDGGDAPRCANPRRDDRGRGAHPQHRRGHLAG